MVGATRAAGSGLGMDRDSGTPLFEQVAERVQELIRKGSLAPGERVPSVREARRRFGVSAGTVIEAYKLLEHRGQIRARPQSGFFVRAGPGQAPHQPSVTRPPLRIREVPVTLSARMFERASRPDVVGLGAALPEPAMLPLATLERHLVRAQREGRAHGYGSPGGTLELRGEIARLMVGAGCAVAPEEVVVTNGATEAIFLSLQAVASRGDVVAIESPTYHGLLDALCGLGLRALPISTCSVDGISVCALERALASRQVRAVLLISSFTNPIGGSLGIEDRRRVAELAREHDVAVIEDDVYGELAFDAERPPAVKSFDTDGRVLYCSSFSKTLSPGLRVGWCVPGRHLQRVLKLKRVTNISTPVGPQLAVARYLEGTGYARHLRRLRRAYAGQVDATIAQVVASFPEGVRVSRPRGGSVVWVEMPEGVDAMRLYEEAEGVGIGISPGPIFDPAGQYGNCIRLNCSHAWTARTADAIATLGRMAQEQLAGRGRKGAGRGDGRARKLTRAS